MYSRSYQSRPDVQARSLANARDPEWVRRREVVRLTKGKLLGHFRKRDLAWEWFREWVRAGRPREAGAMPEFDDWLVANREALILRRDIAREELRHTEFFVSRYRAARDAGISLSDEDRIEMTEVFRASGDPKIAAATNVVADNHIKYYKLCIDRQSRPGLNGA